MAVPTRDPNDPQPVPMAEKQEDFSDARRTILQDLIIRMHKRADDLQALYDALPARMPNAAEVALTKLFRD